MFENYNLTEETIAYTSQKIKETICATLQADIFIILGIIFLVPVCLWCADKITTT
jgi:hypothetical protein